MLCPPPSPGVWAHRGCRPPPKPEQFGCCWCLPWLLTALTLQLCGHNLPLVVFFFFGKGCLAVWGWTGSCLGRRGCLQIPPSSTPPANETTGRSLSCAVLSPSHTPRGGLAALILPAAPHAELPPPGLQARAESSGPGSEAVQHPPTTTTPPKTAPPWGAGTEATLGGAEPGPSPPWGLLLCRLQRKWRM